MSEVKGIAFLVAAEGIEKAELVEPWTAVEQADLEPVLISPQEGRVSDFDALVLPGGVANPDQLRTDKEAVAFVREFVESGKPVAAICHAPWTLVEADVLRGKRLTSWPSLQTDIRNAGGEWVDEKVVVDGNLITSRKPDDIPAFNSAVLEALHHGVSSAAATTE